MICSLRIVLRKYGELQKNTWDRMWVFHFLTIAESTATHENTSRTNQIASQSGFRQKARTLVNMWPVSPNSGLVDSFLEAFTRSLSELSNIPNLFLYQHRSIEQLSMINSSTSAETGRRRFMAWLLGLIHTIWDSLCYLLCVRTGSWLEIDRAWSQSSQPPTVSPRDGMSA